MRLHRQENDGVRYTAPAAGEVLAINRGEKRRLLSVGDQSRRD